MRLEPIDGGYRVRAPAKLNLYLEVLGERPDGYHEIESIFHAVAGEPGDPDPLEDEIEVTAGPSGIEFFCDDPSLPADFGNLAFRAARAVLDRASKTAGLTVRLRKRIPAGAGLGGGSSDAAAVLMAAARALGVDARPEALLDAACGIGSDVPFFLHAGTALVRGRGEIVEPIERTRPLLLAIVVPAQFVSTKEIYDALPAGLTRSPGGHRMLLEALRIGSMREIGERLFNRLEHAIHDRFPSVRSLQEKLQSFASAPVRITGSGSGLYCLCGDRKGALSFVERVGALRLGRAWIATSEASDFARGAGITGRGEAPWKSPRFGSS